VGTHSHRQRGNCGTPLRQSRYNRAVRIEDEIYALAVQLVEGDDTVADLAKTAGDLYAKEKAFALGIAGVNAMIHGGEVTADHPRLVACRERFRDRLKSLLRWARENGRV
jgi:hypothetical protein